MLSADVSIEINMLFTYCIFASITHDVNETLKDSWVLLLKAADYRQTRGISWYKTAAQWSGLLLRLENLPSFI